MKPGDSPSGPPPGFGIPRNNGLRVHTVFLGEVDQSLYVLNLIGQEGQLGAHDKTAPVTANINELLAVLSDIFRCAGIHD